MPMRHERLLGVVIAVGLIIVAYSALRNQPGNVSTSSSVPTVTVTCYLDGCIPLVCPSGGCGSLTITTTIASNMYSTQLNQTLIGTVKIIPQTGAGVYFFDAGSAQYHLVFCNCTGNGPCNCPNIPVFTDGQKIQVTGTIVTPSTYGPVWAPGGDLYVQTWMAV